MVHKWIKKQVEIALKDYLDRLPDEKIASIAAKVMGAQGLTESNYKKLVETASGQKTVTIYFTGGDTAVITNSAPAEKSGPGW